MTPPPIDPFSFAMGAVSAVAFIAALVAVLFYRRGNGGEK